jgi:hypothetical protein
MPAPGTYGEVGARVTSCRLRTEVVIVRYLSDVNLRAVLSVLITRAGGAVEITNAELYDAMLPGSGLTERFHIEETGAGLHLSIIPSADQGA